MITRHQDRAQKVTKKKKAGSDGGEPEGREKNGSNPATPKGKPPRPASGGTHRVRNFPGGLSQLVGECLSMPHLQPLRHMLARLRVRLPLWLVDAFRRAQAAVRFRWWFKVVCLIPALLYLFLFQFGAEWIIESSLAGEIDIETLPEWERAIFQSAFNDSNGFPRSVEDDETWWIIAIDLVTAFFYILHFPLFVVASCYFYWYHALLALSPLWRTPAVRYPVKDHGVSPRGTHESSIEAESASAERAESAESTPSRSDSQRSSLNLHGSRSDLKGSRSDLQGSHSDLQGFNYRRELLKAIEDELNTEGTSHAGDREARSLATVGRSSSNNDPGSEDSSSSSFSSATLSSLEEGRAKEDSSGSSDLASAVAEWPVSARRAQAIRCKRNVKVDEDGWPSAQPWLFLAAWGLLGFAAVTTHIAWPTAAPWWYDEFPNATEATYNTSGSAAGLENADDHLGISVFESIWGEGSIVFGAFPSLHIGWPAQITLHMPHWKGRIFMSLYTIWLIFSSMSLRHHWLVDGLGGILYAIVSSLIVLVVFRLVRRYVPPQKVLSVSQLARNDATILGPLHHWSSAPSSHSEVIDSDATACSDATSSDNCKRSAAMSSSSLFVFREADDIESRTQKSSSRELATHDNDDSDSNDPSLDAKGIYNTSASRGTAQTSNSLSASDNEKDTPLSRSKESSTASETPN